MFYITSQNENGTKIVWSNRNQTTTQSHTTTQNYLHVRQNDTTVRILPEELAIEMDDHAIRMKTTRRLITLDIVNTTQDNSTAINTDNFYIILRHYHMKKTYQKNQNHNPIANINMVVSYLTTERRKLQVNTSTNNTSQEACITNSSVTIVDNVNETTRNLNTRPNPPQ